MAATPTCDLSIFTSTLPRDDGPDYPSTEARIFPSVPGHSEGLDVLALISDEGPLFHVGYACLDLATAHELVGHLTTLIGAASAPAASKPAPALYVPKEYDYEAPEPVRESRAAAFLRATLSGRDGSAHVGPGGTAPTEREHAALTPEEVATVLQVSTKTLANWRYLGGRGPAWIKDGGIVRYPADKLQEWIGA